MIELLARLWCRHRKISWPQTYQGRTTVTCFECAKRLDYDWATMRVAAAPPEVLAQEATERA